MPLTKWETRRCCVQVRGLRAKKAAQWMDCVLSVCLYLDISRRSRSLFPKNVDLLMGINCINLQLMANKERYFTSVLRRSLEQCGPWPCISEEEEEEEEEKAALSYRFSGWASSLVRHFSTSCALWNTKRPLINLCAYGGWFRLGCKYIASSIIDEFMAKRADRFSGEWSEKEREKTFAARKRTFGEKGTDRPPSVCIGIVAIYPSLLLSLFLSPKWRMRTA